MNYQYVDIETLNIVSHVFLQKKHSTYKNGEFTPAELADINAALLVEPVEAGDIRTGKAVLVGTNYVREFKSYTVEHLAQQAKAARDAAKVSPLTVAIGGVDRVFDMDKESQDNINNTIAEWATVEAAAGGTGSIAWTLADNSEITVTLSDLQEVRQAAVVRGLALHVEYQAAKAALL